MLRPEVAKDPAYVYVPSNDDGSVTVIDQATFSIVDHFDVGELVQHVVPSWDLKTLYANASGANRLVPIDPGDGKPGKPIPSTRPTTSTSRPTARAAVVMAERLDRIDFYDPPTWALSSRCRPARA